VSVQSRGLTMSKVAHVRQVLHQLCADEHNERSVTARIMADHGVTTRDVMTLCDVAADVVADMRNREMGAMDG